MKLRPQLPIITHPLLHARRMDQRNRILRPYIECFAILAGGAFALGCLWLAFAM